MYALTGNYKTDQVHVRPLSTGWVNNMLSITFAPMFDWIFLGALGFAVISLAALGVWRKPAGPIGGWALPPCYRRDDQPGTGRQDRVLNEDVVAIVVDESTPSGLVTEARGPNRQYRISRNGWRLRVDVRWSKPARGLKIPRTRWMNPPVRCIAGPSPMFRAIGSAPRSNYRRSGPRRPLRERPHLSQDRFTFFDWRTK